MVRFINRIHRAEYGLSVFKPSDNAWRLGKCVKIVAQKHFAAYRRDERDPRGDAPWDTGFQQLRLHSYWQAVRSSRQRPHLVLNGLAPIGFSNEMLKSRYMQEGELNVSGPMLRAWIRLYLRAYIPISKVGERVLFVRVIGEYRCADR